MKKFKNIKCSTVDNSHVGTICEKTISYNISRFKHLEKNEYDERIRIWKLWVLTHYVYEVCWFSVKIE